MTEPDRPAPRASGTPGDPAAVPSPRRTDPSQWSGPVQAGSVPRSRTSTSDRGARATIVVAVAVTVIQLAGPLLALDAQRRWKETDAAGGAPSDVTTLYEQLETLTLVLLVVAWVVTCTWLSHARSVVEQCSPSSPQARGRVWIWCGWFVPVVLLWFPYQVVRDVLRVRSHHPAASGLVVSWWLSCFAFLLATRVEMSLIPSTTCRRRCRCSRRPARPPECSPLSRACGGSGSSGRSRPTRPRSCPHRPTERPSQGAAA